MRQKQKIATRRLVINAVLIAIYVVLRFFNIPVGNYFRFTLASFSVILCALLYGPVDGLLVGLLGEFIAQVTGPFGLTATTPLWCVGETVRGGVLGLCSRLFLRKGLLAAEKPERKHVVWLLICCGLTGVLAALGQTFALYVDSKMFGYYTYIMVFGVMLWRILIYIVLACLFGYLSLPIIASLKKAKYLMNPVEPKKYDLPITNVDEAISYIHSVCWKGSIPGLGRTQKLLALMGNPHNALKYVHIAGTNGKGSTAAMTANILQKAGYRVGLYTSPYIYRFNERMQVNGEPISDEELTEITTWIRPLAQSMEESPTEFELVSCIAFEYFKRNACDIVVLEVGMGGALDSTNVIPAPEVAVITNIGLDHTEVLGDTVEKIAYTKSGIFKTGCDAVVYRGSASVEAVFEQVCAEKDILLSKADFDGLQLVSHGLEGQTFHCGARENIFLPLLGDHQLHNASVVLSVADRLIARGWNITEENIYDGIATVSWPGRFDIMSKDPLFIIDGGHNPQCIEALVKNIQDYLADKKLIVLTGVLADKDYADMYKPVMPFVEEFVCITPPNPRKLDSALLAQYLTEAGAKATPCESIPEGVKVAKEKAGSDGAVLCFGSLYSIGSIRDALDN